MMTNIKLAGYQPHSSLLSQTLKLFSDFIQKQLPDTISIKTTNNIMELGYAPGAMPDAIESGNFDIGYIATSYFAKPIPELYIFDLPFTFRNKIQAYQLVDGPFTGMVASEFEKKTHLKLLNIWEYGYRHFTNDSHPIRRPTDCQNLPIRTLLNELHPIMFKTLGFKPVTLQVNEFLKQLKTGRKIAQENALTNFYNFGIHEFHHHITLSGHLLGMAILICKRELFENWPREIQEVVTAAALHATLEQRKIAAIEEEVVLKKFSPDNYKIHKLTDEEKSLFEDVLITPTRPYREKIGKTTLAMLGE